LFFLFSFWPVKARLPCLTAEKAQSLLFNHGLVGEEMQKNTWWGWNSYLLTFFFGKHIVKHIFDVAQTPYYCEKGETHYYFSALLLRAQHGDDYLTVTAAGNKRFGFT
jgi:hypothetical protein